MAIHWNVGLWKRAIFFFLYLQLSSMVWDLLQAVEHPCRLSNKTTGNHLVCTFSDSPLSDVVQVVIDMCKQGKQRGRNESTAPLNRKKKRYNTSSPHWRVACHLGLSCAAVMLTFHRPNTDLKTEVIPGDLLQDKSLTHTHTHTCALKCLPLAKVFSPDYWLRYRSKGRGNMQQTGEMCNM